MNPEPPALLISVPLTVSLALAAISNILPLLMIKLHETVVMELLVKDTPKVLLIIKLLNVVALEPSIVCAEDPLKLIVPQDGLVVPVNVPLLVKFPAMEWLNAPAARVEPLPMFTLPAIVNAAAAEAVTVPDVEKFPKMLNADDGKVLVPVPLSIRLSYLFDEVFGMTIVWLPPLYSTVVEPLITVCQVPELVKVPAIPIKVPSVIHNTLPLLMVTL